MERRRSDRYEASLAVDLLERRGPARALTVDVGRHGIFVRTQEPPAERLLLKVLIHLEGGPIEVLASVARRVAPGSPAAARLGPGAGLQFFALGPEARQRWEQYVASLRGEVQLPREQRRQVRYSASFLVKVRDVAALRELFTRDISEGGMFLPTPLLQPVGTEVSLLVVHPDSDQEFELVGAVARIQHGTPRGLGIRLHHLSDEQRVSFRRFVENGLSALRGGPRSASAVEVAVGEGESEEPLEVAVGTPLPEADAPRPVSDEPPEADAPKGVGAEWEELHLEEDADMILEGEVLEPIDPVEGPEAQVEVEHGGDASYLDVRFGPPPEPTPPEEPEAEDDFDFDLVPGAVGAAAAPVGPASLEEALEAAGALANADALGPGRAVEAPAEVSRGFDAAPQDEVPTAKSEVVDEPPPPVTADRAALQVAEALLGASAADGSGPFVTVEEPPPFEAPAVAPPPPPAEEPRLTVAPPAGWGDGGIPAARPRPVAPPVAAPRPAPPSSPREPARLPSAPPPPPGWGGEGAIAPVAAVRPPSAAPARIEAAPAGEQRAAVNEATLQSEIQRRPDAIEPRVQLCRIHLAAGRTEAAISAAEAAVKVSPRHPVALALLARATAAAGRWADADVALRKARRAGHLGDEELGREIARALGR